MNDEELEQLLREVAPARPSDALMTRLQAARPQPAERTIAWPRWALRAALPLAAAAALALWLASPRLAPDPAPGVARVDKPRFEAVASQTYLLGAEPVGIGHDKAGRPYRVLRSYGVRRDVWKNAANGAEVASVVPQQYLLLAKMDVY